MILNFLHKGTMLGWVSVEFEPELYPGDSITIRGELANERFTIVNKEKVFHTYINSYQWNVNVLTPDEDSEGYSL